MNTFIMLYQVVLKWDITLKAMKCPISVFRKNKEHLFLLLHGNVILCPLEPEELNRKDEKNAVCDSEGPQQDDHEGAYLLSAKNQPNEV